MNPRLKRDFAKYLEAIKTQTTSSTYQYKFTPKSHEYLVNINGGHDDFRECGSEPTTFMDCVNIFFYEFSALDKGCRHYNSAGDFFKFLGECGITMNDANRNASKSGSSVFVICIPNKSEAIMKRTYSDLKEFVEKYGDGTTPVPESEKSPYSYMYR